VDPRACGVDCRIGTNLVHPGDQVDPRACGVDAFLIRECGHQFSLRVDPRACGVDAIGQFLEWLLARVDPRACGVDYIEPCLLNVYHGWIPAHAG
jgi:hypothetical protein